MTRTRDFMAWGLRASGNSTVDARRRDTAQRSPSIDLDRAQLAPWTFWLEEIEGQHFARSGVGRQTAEIVDRTDRLTIDFEQDVAALDVRVVRRSHRIDAR